MAPFLLRCLLLPLLIWTCPVHADCPLPRPDDYGIVDFVYDGDTVRLKDGRHVRLIGINAPEMAHRHHRKKTNSPDDIDEPLAMAARERVITLTLENKRVGLIYGPVRKDRYKRTLAHVFAGNRSIGVELARAGLASAIAIPPNTLRLDCYLEAERFARAKKLGIWGHTFFQPVPAKKVTSSHTGYHFVSGRVIETGDSRRSIWLNFPGGFSIRIPKRDLETFRGHFDPRGLRGKHVFARGWIFLYHREPVMLIRHPAQLELTDE